MRTSLAPCCRQRWRDPALGPGNVLGALPGQTPEQPLLRVLDGSPGLPPSHCPEAVLPAVLPVVSEGSGSWGPAPGASHPPESVWIPSGGARSGRGWWPLGGSRTPCPRSSGRGETLVAQGREGTGGLEMGLRARLDVKPRPGEAGRCRGWRVVGFRPGLGAGQGPEQQALNTGRGTVPGAGVAACSWAEPADGGDPLPHTCAGQGHPPVLLLVRGALVGSRRGYGKGRGRRQGAARVVQFPTRGHDDPVVVGKEGELCGGGKTDPQPSLVQPSLSGNRGSPRCSSLKTGSLSSLRPGA